MNNFNFKYSSQLPSLTQEEYQQLRERISIQGIIIPVIIDEFNNVIDGEHRIKIAKELGIEDIPIDIRKGLSEKEKEEMAIYLNLERRHLTREQRQEWAIRLRQEGMSYRAIGDKLGVGKSQIERDIKSTVPFGTIQPDRITGKDGKSRPSQMNFEPEPIKWLQDEAERKEQVLQGITVLANKKQDKALVQWARENNLLINIDRGTVWGNPFILDEDGDRNTVIENYKIYLNLKPSLKKYMDNLYANDSSNGKGKVLACWCYPLPCHGDTLKDNDQLLDYLDTEGCT